MKLVYIPVGMKDLSGPYLVQTALGYVEEIARGRLELVNSYLCLVAELLRGDGTGQFLVRFSTGQTCWVYMSEEWRHVPDGSEPYTKESLIEPVLACA